MQVGMINKNSSCNAFGSGTTIINDAGKFDIITFFVKEGNPSFYVRAKELSNNCSSITIFRSKDNKIEKKMLSYLKNSGIEFVHKMKKYRTFISEESEMVSRIVEKQIQKGKFKRVV